MKRLNVIYIFRTTVINTYIVPTVGQILPKHFIYINIHYNGYYIDMVCRRESGHKDIQTPSGSLTRSMDHHWPGPVGTSTAVGKPPAHVIRPISPSCGHRVS